MRNEKIKELTKILEAHKWVDKVEIDEDKMIVRMRVKGEASYLAIVDIVDEWVQENGREDADLLDDLTCFLGKVIFSINSIL